MQALFVSVLYRQHDSRYNCRTRWSMPQRKKKTKATKPAPVKSPQPQPVASATDELEELQREHPDTYQSSK